MIEKYLFNMQHLVMVPKIILRSFLPRVYYTLTNLKSLTKIKKLFVFRIGTTLVWFDLGCDVNICCHCYHITSWIWYSHISSFNDTTNDILSWPWTHIVVTRYSYCELYVYTVCCYLNNKNVLFLVIWTYVILCAGSA